MGRCLLSAIHPWKSWLKSGQWSEGRSQGLSLGLLILRFLPLFGGISSGTAISPDLSRKYGAPLMFTALSVLYAHGGQGFAFPTGQPQPPLPLGH